MFTTTLILCAGLAFQATPPRQDSDLDLQQKLDAARFTYTAQSMTPVRAEKIDTLMRDLTTASGGRLEAQPAVATPNAVLFRGETDHSAMLHVDRNTGGFVFSRGFDGMRGDASTPDLPKQDVAVLAATAVLGDLGLMPAGLGREVIVEHVGGVNMGVHGEDGANQDFEKLVTVRFARVLDGLSVQGRGSRIVVNLAEQGRLFGLVHRWQGFDARPIEARDKLTVSEIRQIAQRRLAIAAGEAKDAQLESVEIVLFDDGRGVLEPALHVVTQMTYESIRTDEIGTETVETVQNPFDFYIPVLRDARAHYPFRADLQQNATARPMNDR